MKNMILGFLLAVCLMLVAATTVREDLYRSFGPRLIEAVVVVCQDEFNRNRTWHGKPQVSNAELVTALNTALDGIPEYSWMTNMPGRHR
jgi:hypothetical protein